jgi:hypothetical protein
MAAQRSSFSKLQRDRDKQAKAAAKRDRRQNRDTPLEGEDLAEGAADDAMVEVEASVILEQVEQLQREFDADVIDFELYEKRKAELLGRIQI